MGLIEDMFGALSGGRAATEPWLAQAMHGLIGEAGSPGVAIAELLERLKQMDSGRPCAPGAAPAPTGRSTRPICIGRWAMTPCGRWQRGPGWRRAT